MVVTHTYTLHLTHPSAHTHPEQWAANAAAPREQLGALLKSLTSVVVLKVERALLFTPPPTIPAGPET